MTPKFRAIIGQDGKPHFYPQDKDNYEAYVRSFKPDTHVFITIKKAGGNKPRSLRANNYYWGVVIETCRHYFGYEKEEMHEAFKTKFLQFEAVEGLPTILSTAQLSSKNFWAYIDQVRRFVAVEYGIYVPDPNEVEI